MFTSDTYDLTSGDVYNIFRVVISILDAAVRFYWLGSVRFRKVRGRVNK